MRGSHYKLARSEKSGIRSLSLSDTMQSNEDISDVFYFVHTSFVRCGEESSLQPWTVTLTRAREPYSTYKFGYRPGGLSLTYEDMEYNRHHTDDFPRSVRPDPELKLISDFADFEIQFRNVYDTQYRMASWGKQLAAVDEPTSRWLVTVFGTDEVLLWDDPLSIGKARTIAAGARLRAMLNEKKGDGKPRYLYKANEEEDQWV